MSFPPVVNINLQQGCGGGEVYTGFFLRALAAGGIASRLLTHPAATAWDTLAPGVPRMSAATAAAIPERLAAALRGQAPAWLVFHTPCAPAVTAALREQGHFVSVFAHMPLYGRDPSPLAACDLVVPVSAHVRDSARAAGLTRVYDAPMYGIADLRRRPGGDAAALVARTPYDWDRRKVRERVMGAVEPLLEPLRRRPAFRRAGGIALGIVSRLTPIKQFPLQFSLLAPVLARHPLFHLDVFGAGGYTSVRDLRRALAPIAGRVRFWGHQHDMPAVYAGIDYLLTGLPEKEALGLNVLEAQACGTPVLAVQAPPFTETVRADVSGLFYADPRTDAGASFEALLTRLERQPFRLDGARLEAHLAVFSEAAFAARVATLAAWVAGRMAGGGGRCDS